VELSSKQAKGGLGAALLRAARRRTADQRDELAPPQLIEIAFKCPASRRLTAYRIGEHEVRDSPQRGIRPGLCQLILEMMEAAN
jgi:hypothetical protein